MKEVENISYAFVVGSLMHTCVCIRPNIEYVVGMLGRYQNNLGIKRWMAAKNIIRYL